ncbi:transcription antitermination factor NusB [Bacillus sp. 2205SS5-2]|uniref:transcription antitermination factor NusB n=1 Tax=Bacillus sp. 2205SS5-2 TaxID=3109031 RepID=UPI0030071AF4
MKRRTAREKALQALFQMDMSELEADVALANITEDEEGDTYLTQLVLGTAEHLPAIDKRISSHLERWTFDRLAKVDRNILRLAVYEMQFVLDTPHKVIINEAIEVSKTFGDEKSSKFINGVLSKVHDELNK